MYININNKKNYKRKNVKLRTLLFYLISSKTMQTHTHMLFFFLNLNNSPIIHSHKSFVVRPSIANQFKSMKLMKKMKKKKSRTTTPIIWLALCMFHEILYRKADRDELNNNYYYYFAIKIKLLSKIKKKYKRDWLFLICIR